MFFDENHSIYGRTTYEDQGTAKDVMQLREYGEIQFWTGGLNSAQGNRMTITSTGNVNIYGNLLVTGGNLTATNATMTNLTLTGATTYDALATFNRNATVTTTDNNPFQVTGAGGLRVSGNIRLGPDTDSNADYSIKSAGQLTIAANEAATQDNAFTQLELSSGVSTNKSKINIAGSGLGSDNYISFSTLNTERIRIGTSGNVGIGTTSPSSRLHVNGDLKVTGATDFNALATFKNNATVTTTDNNPFQVTGAGGLRVSGPLKITGSGGDQNFDTATDDIYANMRVIRNSTHPTDKDMFLQLGAGATSTLHMYSNNSETMTLKGGNVGIGITNPNSKLHVNGDSSLNLGGVNGGYHLYNTSNTGGGGLYMAAGDGSYTKDASGGDMVLRTNRGTMRFVHGDNKSAMAIDSSNNVNINGRLNTETAKIATSNSITEQGLHLQWNRTGGHGESWIINQKGGGNQYSGIRFGSSNTANVVTENMNINDDGTVNIIKNLKVGGGGAGDIQTPDGNLKITKEGIMFGGNNNGREINSAQISAGKHIANSLNIVGMSSGAGYQDRRIDAWAEGGFYIQEGILHAPKGIRIGRWFIGPYSGPSQSDRGGDGDLVIRDMDQYNTWKDGKGGNDASYYIKPWEWLPIIRARDNRSAAF
jgi:hypothetical protein